MFLRHKWTAVLVGAAFLTTSPASAAKEPLRLKPTSKWEIAYQEDGCRLARKFGKGDQEVLLIFTRHSPGEYFKLSLAGKLVRKSDEGLPLTIQFGPAEAEQRAAFYTGSFGKSLPALFVLGTMRIAPPTDAEVLAQKNADRGVYLRDAPLGKEREAAATSLSLGKPLRNPVILETGPMHYGFAAMEKCTDELLTHWGIDVQKHKNLKRKATPIGLPQNWLVSNDYPIPKLKEGARSIVDYRLNVDQAGLPTTCHIQQSTRGKSSDKSFDDAVCKGLMQRARFEPALDADGHPIASYHIGRVLFQTAAFPDH